jgi:hypothetical protein
MQPIDEKQLPKTNLILLKSDIVAMLKELSE